MGAQVIQPCNSSDGVKPNNKTVNTNVSGGKHTHYILAEAWCNAIRPEVSQLPGTKSARNSEWGGGKRKFDVCLEQLEYSWERGHVHRKIETSYFWACTPPPNPLAHIQSCIIHALHYLRSSISVHHSRAQLYSCHQDLWIHSFMSYTGG